MFGAFDHRIFALGLTLGVTSTPEADFGDELTPRFALGTLARLGALDGMHLALHTQFALEDQGGVDGEKQFDFATVAGRLQIPFARGVSASLRSEFDQMRYNGAVGSSFCCAVRAARTRSSSFRSSVGPWCSRGPTVAVRASAPSSPTGSENARVGATRRAERGRAACCPSCPARR